MMTRKIILLVFVCLLFLSAESGGLLNSLVAAGMGLHFLERPVIAGQDIIFVPDDYKKIQWAVGNATDGDTIFVRAGTYYEQLFVYLSLTIVGEDKNATIIDGREQQTVIIVSSNHVVVKGFTIRNAGLLFPGTGISVYSNSNVLSENIIGNNGEGISLWENSVNNTITRNIIERNIYCGISLDNSTNNMISENTIANHEHGIVITNSENNTIIGNTFMANSHCGVRLDSSDNNFIYHNNFVNSSVHSHNSTNTWDNGAEGNHWAGIEVEDLNGDGISDTPFAINEYNRDNYPLVERWSTLRIHNAFVWNAKTYEVTTYSNCTVASFSFSHPAKQISFNVTGPFDKVGFCKVTIPKLLLVGPWQVLINGMAADTTKVANDTHSSLGFTFSFSTQKVKIVGTEALDTIPPTADAGPDQIVNENTQVTFDGSRSSDNVGITNYTWTFVEKTPRTLTQMNPTHTFNTPGNYTVTLKATDAVGNYDTDTVTVRVLDVPETFPWWIIGLTVVAVGGIILLTAIRWKRKTRHHAQARARSHKR